MAIPTLNNYAMPSQWKANKVNWSLDPKRAALLIHDMQEYFTAFYGENSPLIAALTEQLAAWDKVMNLNVRGYFLLSQAIARHSMIPRRGGRIINVASIAGLAGNPFAMKTIAYNTSKGAVLNFTRALAGEWGAHGINVNAICPGFFKTRMTTVLIETLNEERMTAQAPLRRLGDDEDLKGITLLYASDAGKHITGQWLAVDGGVSAILGG